MVNGEQFQSWRPDMHKLVKAKRGILPRLLVTIHPDCNEGRRCVEVATGQAALKPSGEVMVWQLSSLRLTSVIPNHAGITVKEDPDAIDMEVDVRWSGDANISLAIDLPLPGYVTKMSWQQVALETVLLTL